MQRVFNVDKWTTVEEKQSLAFLNPRPRNVRLEVNAPVKSEVWYLCTETGEAHFLALVEGRDVIEFGSTGPFEITVKGGFVNVFTNDGDDISQKPTAEQPFVKVMERRRRNPELEHIAYMMQVNMNKRLEQQAYELEQLFARRAAQLTAAGVPPAAGSEPAQADGADAPDTPVAGAVEGSGGSDGVPA